MDSSIPSTLEDRSSLGPQKGQHQRHCAACRDCRAIHDLEPMARDCFLTGCYVCADLARIGDEISSTYSHLSNLIKERQHIVRKPRHDALIYGMPVEILSSIFVLVKEATLNSKFISHPDHVVPGSSYFQPSQSPPLLVGAVCKQWREITFTISRLWTDIIIDLDKYPDGQFNMVKKWAHRSDTLPLDITIYHEHGNLQGEASESDFEDLLLALRSLAVRWNNIVLDIAHESVVQRLFNNLQGASHIGLLMIRRAYHTLEPIKLEHPLCPTHLISHILYTTKILFQWDRLVYVDIQDVYDDELLYVICHAQNLRHCTVSGDHLGDNPMPTDPIIHRSLIYLKTTSNIFGHLTLPSLLHLEYRFSDLEEDFNECVESIVGCLNRSCCPLTNFKLDCTLWTNGPLPPFERLPGITSLSLYDLTCQTPPRIENLLNALIRPPSDHILPRLETFSFKLRKCKFLASSWSLLSDLLPSHNLPKPDLDVDSIPKTSIAPRRPLSKVSVYLSDNYDPDFSQAITPTMSKDIFLRLLEVKESGVDLTLMHKRGTVDLFPCMARVYGIEL